MKKDGLTRRKFNTLTAAAFGGIVTGTLAGCGGKDDKKKDDKKGAQKDDKKEVAANDWTGEVHVCRGLNNCKQQGGDKKNDCAGMGVCATAKGHSCHKENDCKYQGGCGETVGNNACKGQGACGVPLKDDTWTKARASFEAAMKKAGKKFGDAPAKKPS